MFFDEKIDETIEILKRDSFFDDMRVRQSRQDLKKI